MQLAKMLSGAQIERFFEEEKKKLCIRGSESIYDFIEDLNEARGIEEIHEICIRIREYFGFDYFSAYIYLPRMMNVPLVYILLDYIYPWHLHYQKSKYLLLDPTIIHPLTKITPTFWESIEAFPSSLNVKEHSIVCEGHDFGIRKLACFPIRGLRGDHGIFRYVHNAAGEGGSERNKEIRHSLPQMQYLLNYVYEAIVRIILDSTSLLDEEAMTSREQEVLTWVAVGKSSAEIGEKLNISENTVLKHLKNIHSKFGVTTRQHAVAKAIAANIISI